MRLPQHLLDSPFFQFTKLSELEKAVANSVSHDEIVEMQRLVDIGVPPVTSRLSLAAMIGVSPGLIWSFETRTQRHYRTFYLPKGEGQRRIDAPRVGLKIVQKWLSVQFQRKFCPANHVFGFIPNRSHVQAAVAHRGARWIFSVDIKDFFQSTPNEVVESALEGMGYKIESARLLANLSCLRGSLAQGAPSSPVLSNICFQRFDDGLLAIAQRYGVRLTRYADDIVYSGTKDFVDDIPTEVANLFKDAPWQFAEEKTHFATSPNRLKVHGLLVHRSRVRLTKGYRNRLRAYKHLLTSGRVSEDSLAKIKGHLAYGDFVDRIIQCEDLL